MLSRRGGIWGGGQKKKWDRSFIHWTNIYFCLPRARASSIGVFSGRVIDHSKVLELFHVSPCCGKVSSIKSCIRKALSQASPEMIFLPSRGFQSRGREYKVGSNEVYNKATNKVSWENFYNLNFLIAGCIFVLDTMICNWNGPGWKDTHYTNHFLKLFLYFLILHTIVAAELRGLQGPAVALRKRCLLHTQSKHAGPSSAIVISLFTRNTWAEFTGPLTKASIT